MDNNLYEMIFKRKSFHLFRDIGNELISEDELKVYRYHKVGKRGIMPKDMVIYYNQIDIGIFLCFIELCLDKNNISYIRKLYVEKNHENENNLVAVYKIKT